MEAAAWVFLSALIIALLAPTITYRLKISEFRQVWIDELRKDIGEYVGLCRKWVEIYDKYSSLNANDEKRFEIHEKELFPTATDALVVLWRIKMRINPLKSKTKKEDDEFIASLDRLLDPGYFAATPSIGSFESVWRNDAEDAVERGRKILKREWEQTKRIRPNWIILD